MIYIICILISWSVSFVYWSHDLYPLYKGYRSWDQYTKDTDHEINIQRIQIMRLIYKGYRSWDQYTKDIDHEINISFVY
jgi:hypothetical protein